MDYKDFDELVLSGNEKGYIDVSRGITVVFDNNNERQEIKMNKKTLDEVKKQLNATT